MVQSTFALPRSLAKSNISSAPRVSVVTPLANRLMPVSPVAVTVGRNASSRVAAGNSASRSSAIENAATSSTDDVRPAAVPK